MVGAPQALTYSCEGEALMAMEITEYMDSRPYDTGRPNFKLGVEMIPKMGGASVMVNRVGIVELPNPFKLYAFNTNQDNRDVHQQD